MKTLSLAGLRDSDSVGFESPSPTRSAVYKSRCSQRVFCQSRHCFPYTSIYGSLSFSVLIRFSWLSTAGISPVFHPSEETGESGRPAVQGVSEPTGRSAASTGGSLWSERLNRPERPPSAPRRAHGLDQPAAEACLRPGSLSAPPERSDGGNLQAVLSGNASVEAVDRVLSRLSMTNRTLHSTVVRGGVRRV